MWTNTAESWCERISHVPRELPSQERVRLHAEIEARQNQIELLCRERVRLHAEIEALKNRLEELVARSWPTPL